MSSRGAVIGAPTRDDESQRLLYEHEPESIPSMPTLQSHRPLFELCNSKHFKLSAAERKRRRELKKDEEAAAKAARQDHENSNAHRNNNNDPLTTSSNDAIDTTDSNASDRLQIEMVNGTMRVKESSLQYGEVEDVHQYTEVVGETRAPTTYKSFLPKQFTGSWGIEETRQFFLALQQCGTDFTMMQAFFPNRSRRQLKLKFYREEKAHPELIKRFLESPVALDVDPFIKRLGHIEGISTSTSSTIESNDGYGVATSSSIGSSSSSSSSMNNNNTNTSSSEKNTIDMNINTQLICPNSNATTIAMQNFVQPTMTREEIVSHVEKTLLERTSSSSNNSYYLSNTTSTISSATSTTSTAASCASDDKSNSRLMSKPKKRILEMILSNNWEDDTGHLISI